MNYIKHETLTSFLDPNRHTSQKPMTHPALGDPAISSTDQTAEKQEIQIIVADLIRNLITCLMLMIYSVT